MVKSHKEAPDHPSLTFDAVGPKRIQGIRIFFTLLSSLRTLAGGCIFILAIILSPGFSQA
jgi:hypothetical protein